MQFIKLLFTLTIGVNNVCHISTYHAGPQMKQFIEIRHIIFQLIVFLICAYPAEAQSTKKPVRALLYRVVKSNGVEAAVEQYRELQKNGSQQYDLSQNQLNKLGYRLLNEGKTKDAVAIFKLNSETYPQSINVWDSLGEGYLGYRRS